MAESCTGKADSGGKMNYKNVKIAEGARIAKQSVILGNVTIGRDSCVLYYAVIRGDDAPVVIGEETNIQENCTIHVSHNMPVHIGKTLLWDIMR